MMSDRERHGQASAWQRLRRPHFVVGFTAGAALAWPAHAGGFHSPYQSATAIGTAFAGASARSDDAGFFFYNPASIAGISQRQTFFDVRAFSPNVRIEPTRAVSPLQVPVLDDGASGNIARDALAVGSVTAIPLAPGLVLGLASSAPFASDVETRGLWAGRYHLQKSYMVGLNATGALAWQATPWLALSAGLQVQRMTNEFRNLAVIPQGAAQPVEAEASLQATGWAASPVAGAVLTPIEGTRIGLSWRSAMTHRMHGETGARAPGIAVEQVSYDLDLPHIASLGLEQRLGRDWRLFAEWQWAGWSRFKGFDFSFASGRPDERRAIEWRDTSIIAVGLGYRLLTSTEVTMGAALDKGAARAGSGTTLSPDSNKLLVGAGLLHDAAGLGRFSLSYGLLLLDDGTVRASNLAGGTLEGKLVGRMHMLAMGYTYAW